MNQWHRMRSPGIPNKQPATMVPTVQTASKKHSENYRFPVPDLKVGTLDSLLTASVDLERLEATAEGVLSKIKQAWVDILELKAEHLDRYFLINGVPIPEFLTKFKWDPSKFPVRQTMKAIQDQIERLIAGIDLETKSLHSDYVKSRTELAVLERYEKGPLLTRNISEFVKKEDFVLDSQHLLTVLVVVAKSNYHDWYSSYERLDDEVVPRSTNLLYEDEDYGLFNVTLFKRHLDQFKDRAKEKKFFVKDFIYNKNKIDEERQHLTDLRQQMVVLMSPLLRALRINFSECYNAFIHIKTMRLFVECVLRYGLPAKFVCIMMVVPKRNIKKLREMMFKEFSYLDGSLPKEENNKTFSSQPSQLNDYFPYVCIKVNVEPTDFK